MMAFTAYESIAQTVYKTNKNLHTKKSAWVKTVKKGFELADAIIANYVLCGHCKVSAAVSKKALSIKKKNKPNARI
jgi:hypothetical protein